MTRVTIFLALLSLSFAAREVAPTTPLGASIQGEIIRGLIDGLQVNVNDPSACVQ